MDRIDVRTWRQSDSPYRGETPWVHNAPDLTRFLGFDPLQIELMAREGTIPPHISSFLFMDPSSPHLPVSFSDGQIYVLARYLKSKDYPPLQKVNITQPDEEGNCNITSATIPNGWGRSLNLPDSQKVEVNIHLHLENYEISFVEDLLPAMTPSAESMLS